MSRTVGRAAEGPRLGVEDPPTALKRSGSMSPFQTHAGVPQARRRQELWGACCTPRVDPSCAFLPSVPEGVGLCLCKALV